MKKEKEEKLERNFYRTPISISIIHWVKHESICHHRCSHMVLIRYRPDHFEKPSLGLSLENATSSYHIMQLTNIFYSFVSYLLGKT